MVSAHQRFRFFEAIGGVSPTEKFIITKREGKVLQKNSQNKEGNEKNKEESGNYNKESIHVTICGKYFVFTLSITIQQC